MSASAFDQQPVVLPPMEQGGSEDVASFVGLDLALRSTSELVREGSNNLSPKALSLLTAGMRWFQEVHLGKDAKGLRWPLVRIPDHIFLDRNRGGPLYTALLSAFRYKATQSWRSFDFQSPKRYDDNVALFKRIERDLIAAGYLSRPTVYLDESIPQKNRHELEGIAVKFGASLVKDHTKATHIVAYDEEEMDTEEEIMKEEERASNGEPPDRTYLRTVAIVDTNSNPNSKDGSKNGNNSKSNKSSQKNLFPHPMALVHWWFWPTSADEWIPAADVDGIPDNEESPRAPNGAWVVSCKFLRDVARFNEWGLEIDYVIMDFEKKIPLFQHPSNWSVGRATRTGAHLNAVAIGLISGSGDISNTDSSVSKPGGISNTANGNTKDTSISSNKPASSNKRDRDRDRRGGSGMNPRLLNTGEFGPRGEKYKMTVFDGALRVPSIAQEILQKFTSTSMCENKNPSYDLSTNAIELLAPSMDETLRSIIVTELSESMAFVNKTMIINRRFVKTEGLKRIRGGGDEGQSISNENDQGQSTSTLANDMAISTSLSSETEITLQPQTKSELTPNPISNLPPPDSSAISTATLDSNPISMQIANPLASAMSKSNNVAPSTNIPNTLTTNTSTIQTLNSSNNPTLSNIVNNPLLHKQNMHMNVATPSLPITASTNGTNITKTAKPLTSMPNIPTSAEVLAAQIVNNQGNHMIAQSSNKILTSIPIQPPAHTPSVQQKHTPPNKMPMSVATSTVGNSNMPNPTPLVKTQVPTPSPLTQRWLSNPPKYAPILANKSNPPPPHMNTAAPIKNYTIPPSTGPMNPVSYQSLPQSIQSKPKDNSIQPLISMPVPQQPIPSIGMTSTMPSTTATAPVASSNISEATVPIPKWYNKATHSHFEQMMLPEWFDNSSPHRNASNYIQIREGIIGMAKMSPNRFITATAVRKKFAGDAGSLLRLHSFLMTWGFINGSSIGDSMSTSRLVSQEVTKSSSSSPTAINSTILYWTDSDREILAKSVVGHARKKRKFDVDNDVVMSSITGTESPIAVDEYDMSIDWDAVATEVGNGSSGSACQMEFLSLTLDEESVDDDQRNSPPKDLALENKNADASISFSSDNHDKLKEEIIRDLVSKTDPEVIEGALMGAFKVTQNLSQSKNAALLAGIATKAMEKAKEEEETVNELLLEILDQRMLKLENRMSLLDDVESMLDVERTALELERRDLYTARCRYWLGGGNGLG